MTVTLLFNSKYLAKVRFLWKFQLQLLKMVQPPFGGGGELKEWSGAKDIRVLDTQAASHHSNKKSPLTNPKVSWHHFTVQLQIIKNKHNEKQSDLGV